jgi:trans-2-enoyl-CoA reductase
LEQVLTLFSCDVDKTGARRNMSVSAKALKYAARSQPGEALSFSVEDTKLASPSGKQALVRFLAAAISPADYRVMTTSNEPSKDAGVRDVTKRFAKAQAVTPVDPLIAALGGLPSVPAVGGLEGVAVVESAGPGSSLKAGDWVVPAPGVGSWTTHAVIDDASLTPVPNNIPVEYAACLSLAPATAYRLLNDFASLKEGDAIVLNGANTLTGQALVQLAAARGIKTVAVMIQQPNVAEMSGHLKACGATVVIAEHAVKCYQMKDLMAAMPAPKLALDGVGGESGRALSRLLPKGGTLVCYGNVDVSGVDARGEEFLIPAEKNIAVKRFYLSEWLSAAKAADKSKMMAELAGLVAVGKLSLLIERERFANHRLALRKGWEAMRERRLVMTFD